ncbi:MAG: hypothetical protein HY791_30600 [Deltaproteobacteria bacterium]|nr:hypothetical protein [Deltaproteobacteria bacterium]
MMGRIPVILGVIAAGVLTGACGATREQLVKRASFDLNCPAEQLEVHELDGRTNGIRGCGRQATYVEQCEVVQGSRGNCTWIMNTDAEPSPSPKSE